MVDFLNCFQIIFAIGYMLFIRPHLQSMKFDTTETPRSWDITFFVILFLISILRFAK